MAGMPPVAVLDNPDLDADSSRRDERGPGGVRDSRPGEPRHRISVPDCFLGRSMNAPLYSWGRYPLIPQQGHACEAIERLPTHIADIIGRHRSSLPFGNGRSYGDSCLAASDHVLDMRRLDRFIAADWQTGMVRLEAGMTLSQLLDAAIPHGWFLPVTPGTRFVTLGGAVANDVHGKNHHRRGTFGCHVKRFGLIRQGEPPMI
ncbi:FAD linked oxidase, partial [Pseudomonas coronafaciens pv. coronafaciens]